MEEETIKKKRRSSLKQELKSKIIQLMIELGLWKENLQREIPTCWDNFENFVIFNSRFFKDESWNKAGSQLWNCISELFSGKSIALQSKIQNNDFRSPNAHIVHGDSPWVKYLDNGVRYTWNVEFTMFCTGNVTERHRIGNLNCEGKIIVDMFAGIGYFVLPYLVHAKAQEVIACEWNPVSLQALKINVVDNKVAEKCVVLEGDVRVTCPRGIADHINLGLIPSCEQYWSVAAEILKPTGGTLHVHGNVTSKVQSFTVKCEKCISLLETLKIGTTNLQSKEVKCNGFKIKISAYNVMTIEISEDQIGWKWQEWFVWSIHVTHSFCMDLYNITKTEWEVTPIFLHRVKAYAPHIDHLVLDVSCRNMMLPIKNL
uniref:tRNA(Phe) (4-demethylwyosine(37)-C(7)) aminocarboxypropyltransferase n=1 Tax=Homalodisca liturata TaxID=320908 RepID=A0A1B6JCN1_9HEMI